MPIPRIPPSSHNNEPMRTWQAIVQEIEQSDDPKKISELAEELNRALLEGERLKVRRKLSGR